MEVPKTFLNTAPVYPIMAETSNSNKIWMRAKSIGFKAVMATMAFSIGYSESWNNKNKTIPSKIKAKYNHNIMAIPMPLALSRVIMELKQANEVKITLIKLPMRIIINPIFPGA